VADVVPVADAEAGLQLLASRGADALFLDRALLQDAVARSKAGNVQVLESQFRRDVVALAMRRDDDDFRLLVDRTLSRLYRSKDIAPMYAKYFGPPSSQAMDFFDLIALPD
jgi:ABC-type amino acid transport substrate-binding protein